MEKFLTTLKIVISVLIVFAVGAFIIIFYESGKAEKEYQNSISYMKKGEWAKALECIEKVPFYKDANDIYAYVYPNKIFYDNYSNDNDAIESYKKGITFINTKKTSLKGPLKQQYTKDLDDLLNVFEFKISELNAKSEDKVQKDAFNEAIALIRQGDFLNAQNKLFKINSVSLTHKKEEILKYINLLNVIKSQGSDKKNNAIIEEAISKLNPDYNGELSEDIKKTVQGYFDINKWVLLYNKNKSINTAKEGQVLSITTVNNDVKVGISKQNVISILGTPQKDNIISNRYGIFEEMVYSDGRVIFLENNIVVVIKG
ncbi:hypothetical protein SAMN05443428_103156 [Caloramator quimbayensis]|uniref:Uncharacterized protein n=1 Tax=Caloramator quimbayensis TaxID=1147123 RepID=A0A1T4WRW6_9CLOT|nr:hypothetical protein [Caloramator quimbayensis]SKA80076.1 hypothetical protein SAMN05443428_103156 [Caloramator quimbayensis]